MTVAPPGPITGPGVVISALIVMLNSPCDFGGQPKPESLTLPGFDYQDESRVTTHLFPTSPHPMVSRDIETEAEEEKIQFQNVITTIQQYASYTVFPCALTIHLIVLNVGEY